MFEFGVGYSELFVLAIIAVIVIGPKDLPVVLRKFGQIMQRVRGMAKEFQGHVDVAMKDAGMGDLKKDLNDMKSAVNGSMSMTSDKSQLVAPKSLDFNKYFGDSPFEGETRVAGQAVATEAKPIT